MKRLPRNSCCSECAGRVPVAVGGHRRRIAEFGESVWMVFCDLAAWRLCVERESVFNAKAPRRKGAGYGVGGSRRGKGGRRGE